MVPRWTNHNQQNVAHSYGHLLSLAAGLFDRFYYASDWSKEIVSDLPGFLIIL
jgi:hypothetical protein